MPHIRFPEGITRSSSQHRVLPGLTRRLVIALHRVRVGGSGGLCVTGCIFVDCAACSSSSRPSDSHPYLSPALGEDLHSWTRTLSPQSPSSEHILCNCLSISCSYHCDFPHHALSCSSFSALWNAFQLSVPFLYFYGNHNPSLIAFPPCFSPPPPPFCK